MSSGGGVVYSQADMALAEEAEESAVLNIQTVSSMAPGCRGSGVGMEVHGMGWRLILDWWCWGLSQCHPSKETGTRSIKIHLTVKCRVTGVIKSARIISYVRCVGVNS